MKRPSNRIIIFSVLAILIIAVLIWWTIADRSGSGKRFVTVKLDRGSIAQSVSANGTLNPVKLVNVGSQVSGIVKKLHVDFNDRVKEGQILLELDPALMEAQLQQSMANVANAEAQLELATSNEARTRNLYMQEYVTRQEMEQSIQGLKSARAQLELARAQSRRDRTNLSNTIIRSPVSGVVVSRMVDTGQTVAASLQAPTLFTIAQDLRKMQIDTSYAEADVGAIKVGQHANFRVDAFPNTVFNGKVHQVRINPTTQQNVVTYDVVVSVDNTDLKLMPGMTAYVNITVARKEDALKIPNAALRFRPAETGKNSRNQKSDMGKARSENPQDNSRAKNDTAMTGTVHVLQNGLPSPVRIVVGITDNKFTEAMGEELKVGDEVIVDDLQPASKSHRPQGMRLF